MVDTAQASDTPPSTLTMTYHATMRFQTRIQNLPADVIQEWINRAWQRRSKVHFDLRTFIRKRKFKDIERKYLECRAPNGKPMFLALSEDCTAVLTVLDIHLWNAFLGTKPTPEIRMREELMAKLRGMED
jgi:hypothetical protein